MVSTPGKIPSGASSVPISGTLGAGRIEEPLRWGEDRCQSLVETMMDGFAYCQMIYDEEGRPVDWVHLAVNSAFVSLTGLENVVGKRVTEAIPGIRESSPELFEIYSRVASGGAAEKCETEVAPLSMWLSMAVSCPAPGYFINVFEDITERKRMEAALRLSQLCLDRSGDMLHWIAPDGRLIYVSDSSAKRLERTREELLSLSVFDIDPTMTREAWPAHWQKMKAMGSFTFETVHKTKAGEIFPVEVTVNYLEWGDKEYNFAFTRDITERRRLESSLRLTQLSVDRAADLIRWTDRDGRLLYVSDSNCLRHGYSREELLGMTIFDLDPVLTRTTWEQQWQEMQRVGTVVFEAVHRTKTGELFPVEVVVNYVRDGEDEYNFAYARDISRRKKAEQELHKAKAALEVQNLELEQAGLRLKEANRELLDAQDALALQSRTDALTGCLNRGAVFSRLGQELERAKRDGGSLAVGMIDVDHFKKINDTYGHPTGDAVLCEVVARALGALRPYDVFGRFGGEEFLVVILGADEEEARSALERIRAAIASEPVPVDDNKIPVRVSIGGVVWDKEPTADLIGAADQALYRAKALGRNRLVMRGLAGRRSAVSIGGVATGARSGAARRTTQPG